MMSGIYLGGISFICSRVIMHFFPAVTTSCCAFQEEEVLRV
jgi:hypothetical protein